MDKFYFNPQFKCFIIDPKLFVLHIFFNKIKNYEKIDFSVFYLKVMQKFGDENFIQNQNFIIKCIRFEKIKLK